jgi:BirA family biotin operon repressor/biotin-[acetyl-CoA-carboxylase] ligase
VARLAGTLDPADGKKRAVSATSLADDLGVSPAAIHEHVTQLHDLGFGIEAVAGTGYRLSSPFSDLLVGEAVLPLLLAAPERGAGESQAARNARDPAKARALGTTGVGAGAILCPGAATRLREGEFFAGLPYRYEACTDSTNRQLKVMAPSGLASGAVAVTDHQGSGRGRLGRRWISEPGKDLTFSVLLRPRLMPGKAHLLSLAAAVAVAETLESLPGLQAGSSVGPVVTVKWPNDVLLAGKKVCGILLEGSMDADRLHWAVAGLGLNVNGAPEAALEACGEDRSGRGAAVSLLEHLGREVPRGWLLAQLLERLAVRWGELESGIPSPDCVDLRTALRERDALAGSRVLVCSGLREEEVVASGVAAGIGPGGELLVRETSGAVRAVIAGEVTVAPAS